jgi:hypothetical protein
MYLVFGILGVLCILLTLLLWHTVAATPVNPILAWSYVSYVSYLLALDTVLLEASLAENLVQVQAQRKAKPPQNTGFHTYSLLLLSHFSWQKVTALLLEW